MFPLPASLEGTYPSLSLPAPLEGRYQRMIPCAREVFSVRETHGRVLRPANRVIAKSQDVGWRSMFAAIIEEAPFEATEPPVGHPFLIYHLARPTEVTRGGTCRTSRPSAGTTHRTLWRTIRPGLAGRTRSWTRSRHHTAPWRPGQPASWPRLRAPVVPRRRRSAAGTFRDPGPACRSCRLLA